VIFSLSEKLWTEKYPSRRFNHLSTTSTSISPSNNGISKFTCTLKGVAWPLHEYASHVGTCRRIYVKLSIISFLCRARYLLNNILIGSIAPSSLFSSPMGFCHTIKFERFCDEVETNFRRHRVIFATKIIYFFVGINSLV
jgi:hypothetical protein